VLSWPSPVCWEFGGRERAHWKRACPRGRVFENPNGGNEGDVPGVDERWLAVLDLEVQPRDGPPFEARVERFVPLLDVPRFQAGRIVEVRYDPKDKTRVIIV
jgi:hypothetical protein